MAAQAATTFALNGKLAGGPSDDCPTIDESPHERSQNEVTEIAAALDALAPNPSCRGRAQAHSPHRGA